MARLSWRPLLSGLVFILAWPSGPALAQQTRQAQARPTQTRPTPKAYSRPEPIDTTPTGGKIELAETSYHAGTVERGVKIQHTFIVKNVGTGDLRIHAKPG